MSKNQQTIKALMAAIVFLFPITGQGAGQTPTEGALTKLQGLKIAPGFISLPTTGADIVSAVLVKADDKSNTLGEYCRVLGAVHPVDKTAQDINFQVNLPSKWNGKALQYGGGGYNGVIPNTLGRPTLGLTTIPVPLAQGYITFGDDSGHSAKDSNDASFAMNDEALENYAYAHIRKARDVMVVLAKIYYGAEPRRLYFQGGSTGGREALTAGNRWPDLYDGLLVNYPTANFIGLRLWGAALGRAIYMNSSEGWIPPELVKTIYNESMKRFDGLDGVEDGIISDIAGARRLSQGLLEDLAWRPGNDYDLKTALTPIQILRTLQVYHDGYSLPYPLAHGVTRYPGYNSLEGIEMNVGTAPTYRNPLQSGPNAHHAARADQALKYIIARDPNFNLLDFDIMNPGKYKDRMVHVSNMIDATNPDWTVFARRGGKILFVQGWADPSVSPLANIDLYNAIVASMGRRAADDFLRLYLVPGLAHGGGDFFVSWDNLNILDNWVENGAKPPLTPGYDTNKATKGRSRPMPEYPGWIKYNGSGDPNDWHNYTVVKP